MSKRKVVLDEKEGSVMVGVMQESCDPLLKTIEGTLETAIATLPAVLAEAQTKWQANPRNPAYKAPPEPPKAKAEPKAKVEPKEAGELPLLGTPKVEATAEPKKVAEPPAAMAEPKPVHPAVKQALKEQKAAATPVPAAEPRLSSAGAAAPTPAVSCEYYLEDGRGPYTDIQKAMDDLGLDKATRPQHQRWDRLSSILKKRILRRPKA